ncbi:hypothetical protein T265_10752 [Opisthorchis viverrini]|uniref:MD-2-related lipid-recognition domain-containing protein n=1 Tax=Opisthorchis viverrini TaxID=6198 RepID=A0A074Z160_OPIVI|nr:hypothetical protein T265_10752 [Opisthorchis viverrini]KER20781.1 hypothetical protein T265_10752 [Opisthorchis viverrini]
MPSSRVRAAHRNKPMVIATDSYNVVGSIGRAEVYGVVGGVAVPFAVDVSQICGNVEPTCPLQPGRWHSYRRSIDIAPTHSQVDFAFRWVLMDAVANVLVSSQQYSRATLAVGWCHQPGPLNCRIQRRKRLPSYIFTLSLFHPTPYKVEYSAGFSSRTNRFAGHASYSAAASEVCFQTPKSRLISCIYCSHTEASRTTDGSCSYVGFPFALIYPNHYSNPELLFAVPLSQPHLNIGPLIGPCSCVRPDDKFLLVTTTTPPDASSDAQMKLSVDGNKECWKRPQAVPIDSFDWTPETSCQLNNQLASLGTVLRTAIQLATCYPQSRILASNRIWSHLQCPNAFLYSSVMVLTNFHLLCSRIVVGSSASACLAFLSLSGRSSPSQTTGGTRSEGGKHRCVNLTPVVTRLLTSLILLRLTVTCEDLTRENQARFRLR